MAATSQSTIDDERKRELEHLRQITHLMDEAFRIPIVGVRIGVDALMGLVPVVGDLASLVVGAYFLLRSLRFSLPATARIEMAMNLVADAAVGSIPLAGDLFDVFFKAHRRNLRVLERHLGGEAG